MCCVDSEDKTRVLWSLSFDFELRQQELAFVARYFIILLFKGCGLMGHGCFPYFILLKYKAG
jgi:hypothetical protein